MRGFIFAAALSGLMIAPAQGQDRPPSLSDSFALGGDSGVLCQVESKGRDPALGTMFDRAFRKFTDAFEGRAARIYGTA